MTRKIIAQILKIIAKIEGVEIPEEARSRVEAELGDVELSADDVIGPDQKIVKVDDWREVHADLKSWKEKARGFESERDDLRSAMDAGDSDNARKVEAYKNKLDKMEPVLNRLLERERSRWESIKDKIPENLRAKFAFPEKDEELSNDELIENLAKVDEYREISTEFKTAVDAAENPEEDPKEKGAPDVPRPSPTNRPPRGSTPDVNTADLNKGVEDGYGYQPATTGKR